MNEMNLKEILILFDELRSDFDLYIDWPKVNPDPERRKKELIFSHFNRLKELVSKLIDETNGAIIPEYKKIRGLN